LGFQSFKSGGELNHDGFNASLKPGEELEVQRGIAKAHGLKRRLPSAATSTSAPAAAFVRMK
jgi:hypothetical protein